MQPDADEQECSPRKHNQTHLLRRVALLFPQVHHERTHHLESMLELELADV